MSYCRWNKHVIDALINTNPEMNVRKSYITLPFKAIASKVKTPAQKITQLDLSFTALKILNI